MTEWLTAFGMAGLFVSSFFIFINACMVVACLNWLFDVRTLNECCHCILTVSMHACTVFMVCCCCYSNTYTHTYILSAFQSIIFIATIFVVFFGRGSLLIFYQEIFLKRIFGFFFFCIVLVSELMCNEREWEVKHIHMYICTYVWVFIRFIRLSLYVYL